MADDSKNLLAQGRMSALQIIAVTLTVALNALDGFDVLAISFASPGIASEWGISRQDLGIVLSMELIGMGLGSITLGRVADAIGRKPTILISLVLMAIGMFGATTSQNVVVLSAWRVLTGLGIGGMLAACNAMAAEFSNDKWRNFSLSLMVIGYPIGGVIGGSIAALLLQHHDWRAVFLFGASATLIFIPLVIFLLPESVSYLVTKQPKDALAKVNRILQRARHEPLAALPAPAQENKAAGIAGLFAPSLSLTTITIILAYFLHISAFYYIVKWIPKLVVDMGFTPSSAAGVLVWYNVGGAIGGALFGLVAALFGIKWPAIMILLGSMAAIIYFGRGAADLETLGAIAAVTGFFTNSGVVVFYTLFATSFPTQLRSTGTGLAIGIGRGGAMAAPILAGFMFQHGLGLQAVSFLISLFSLCAAIAVGFLKPSSKRARAQS